MLRYVSLALAIACGIAFAPYVIPSLALLARRGRAIVSAIAGLGWRRGAIILAVSVVAAVALRVAAQRIQRAQDAVAEQQPFEALRSSPDPCDRRLYSAIRAARAAGDTSAWGPWVDAKLCEDWGGAWPAGFPPPRRDASSASRR